MEIYLFISGALITYIYRLQSEKGNINSFIIIIARYIRYIFRHAINSYQLIYNKTGTGYRIKFNTKTVSEFELYLLYFIEQSKIK